MSDTVTQKEHDEIILRMRKTLKAIVCLTKQKEELEETLLVIKHILESNKEGLSKEKVSNLLTMM